MTPRAGTGWYRAGLAFVFLWFFLGGIAHFAFTEAEMRIVPPWVPSPRIVVWVTGVLELLGAVGLLLPDKRVRAAWGLFLLTIAVTPANVHMLLHADEFPSVPHVLLVARLPLQVALLALVAWIAIRSRRFANPAGPAAR